MGAGMRQRRTLQSDEKSQGAMVAGAYPQRTLPSSKDRETGGSSPRPDLSLLFNTYDISDVLKPKP